MRNKKSSVRLKGDDECCGCVDVPASRCARVAVLVDAPAAPTRGCCALTAIIYYPPTRLNNPMLCYRLCTMCVNLSAGDQQVNASESCVGCISILIFLQWKRKNLNMQMTERRLNLRPLWTLNVFFMNWITIKDWTSLCVATSYSFLQFRTVVREALLPSCMWPDRMRFELSPIKFRNVLASEVNRF